MNLRDLTYLLAVAKYKHFGQAAKACFVSQPTLSMQIKKLEQELDVQLIERNNKRVLITSIGQQVIVSAQRVIDEAAQLKALALTANDPLAGELVLGVIPTLAPYLLPKIVPAITAAFPKLALFLVERQTEWLMQALLKGELDAVILALPVVTDSLVCHSLFQEDFLLAVHQQHPLAKRKRINQAELEDYSLMLLEEGHCLRDNALAICQMNNAKTPQNFRASSLETLRQMVVAGVGMTLMPQLAVDQAEGICYLPFTQPRPQREIGLLWRHSSVRSELLLSLTGLVKQTVGEL